MFWSTDKRLTREMVAWLRGLDEKVALFEAAESIGANNPPLAGTDLRALAAKRTVAVDEVVRSEWQVLTVGRII